MNTRPSPLTWAVPDWHPDYGDAGVELEHLRSLALALPNVVPGAVINLEMPEPGLMYLSIEQQGVIVAEVYSSEIKRGQSNRRFGLFMWRKGVEDDEVEKYADTLDEVLGFFSSCEISEWSAPSQPSGTKFCSG